MLHPLDGAIGTRFGAFSAAAASIGYKHPAVLLAHSAESARADARGVRAVATNLRQLVLAKARPGHRHARASVPEPARRHAGPTVDALGQVADKDLPHRLIVLLARRVALDTVL